MIRFLVFSTITCIHTHSKKPGKPGKSALAWKNMFCQVPEIAESTRLYGLYLFFLSCGMHGVISCFVASHQALRTQSRQLLLQWNIIQQVMLTQYTCFSGSLGPNMSEVRMELGRRKNLHLRISITRMARKKFSLRQNMTMLTSYDPYPANFH